MARPTKEEILAAVHREALTEFDKVQAAIRDERKQCLQDRRFYSIPGAQWEGDLGDQFANKPKFEVNKIHLALIRIFNEYRNNRITVDFTSKDGVTDDKLADTCDGLYRADELDSGAEEAYDNAFEEAVGGGFGGWRLRAAYEDEEDPENERQCILIEPIYDADSSLFFDLQAKRQDKKDAKRAWLLTSMTPEAYEEEYGDDPVSFDKTIQQVEFDWATSDVVYIAEYYRVEERSQTVQVWKMLDGEERRITPEELAEEPELPAELTAIGARLDREKRIKRRRVHKYVLSGNKVLEDCGYIAGKHIPLVPVYGKRWFVENVERCMGHVRLAKDAQRLANMLRSKLGEISSQSSVEKPIFTPEQMAGHQNMWSEDNVKNYPYMLVNPVTDVNGQQVAAGPIGYTKPPQVPPALAALLQISEQDMQDLLGNQQAGEEIQPNISGKVVELIQNRLDMQTFIYMSNMAKAMRRSGEIWLSMKKDIVVEEGRRMKVVGAQGEIGSVEMLRPVVDDETGKTVTENDLSAANFDVNVEVGPSSSSKRSATVRALTGMASITDDPETKQVLGAMAMMNMEGEGIADAREFFRRKLLRLGVVKPTDEEKAQLEEEKANAPKDANQTYLESAAREADANAVQANAKTVLTVAQAEKTQAETAEIAAGIDQAEAAQAMEVIKTFGEPNSAGVQQ